MPSTVRSVLRAAGINPEGVVPWGTPPPLDRPGVYLVALNEHAEGRSKASACPLSQAALENLLSVRPELRVDGVLPDAQMLADRVSRFWLPDETVLYIGLAGTSVRGRVTQYYRTPLGARKPHAGGWFLKLLANLESLHVHYAACSDPEAAESRMLRHFCEQVSAEARAALFDSAHPFPYANLEWPHGIRKAHGITGAKEARSRRADGDAVRPQPAVTPRSRTRPAPLDISAINKAIQSRLVSSGKNFVTAVEAAQWLDQAHLLRDSLDRPGRELRKLLRAGLIEGQQQDNTRWTIHRI